MYTDEQKKVIYSQWCEYQKMHNIPITEYPYQAYTDDAYNLWVKVITMIQKKAGNKNGN